jgi:hypothetical protein
VRQDGVRREEFTLTPGVEIGIGATTLIAESPQTIALREFCGRMLGWECDPAVIDHALRAIRLAMTRRTALVLRGSGDLVPVAHALHRRTMGAEAPFIVCDRRRRSAAGSVRAPENHESGVSAFEAASGGSLCVRSSRLPRDFSLLLERLREPEPSVQLVVCLDRDDRGALLAGPVPIDVPSLRCRMRDVPRLVDAFAADAIAALGAPAGCLTREELAWVARHSAMSLADIEKATLRLVARKVTGSLGQAAALLGMAPVSLARWLERRSREDQDDRREREALERRRAPPTPTSTAVRAGGEPAPGIAVGVDELRAAGSAMSRPSPRVGVACASHAPRR